MTDRHKNWPSKLQLHPSAFVAPGAIVVGEVAIGARSSIWFNTVVRGDSERIAIGDDTNIQDNSTVHVDEGMPAIVGSRVTVGHRAIVHGCVIEDDVLVGMGAVVLSGAHVGAGSLIGASALVKEGQVIPPGSLALGAPARVIGPVSDAHREAIRIGAAHYVDLSRAYLRRGISSVMKPVLGDPAHLPRIAAPMDYLEWEQRLDSLREGPDWMERQLSLFGAAAFRQRPAPKRWSALEVACHLRDVDRDIHLPRIERVLAEEFPALADIAAGDWAETRRWNDEEPVKALTTARTVRATLVRRIESLRPSDWQRALVHPRRGPQTLADFVRFASEHDLSHRRQVRDALGVFA